MLARRTHRRSLFALLVVVSAGFGLVGGLAAWQRSDVIAELTDQIAHGEKEEATAAVRQLAAIPNPPMAILVDAASSDDRATAEAAQVALNRIVGQWKQQLDSGRRASRVAAQLTELASHLAGRRRTFTSSDHPWLAELTRKIVRLANRCPPKKTPLVAMHCDQILTAIGRENSNDSTPVTQASSSQSGLPSAASRDVPAPNYPESDQARLEREFSTFPTPPIATRPTPESEPASPPASPIPLPPRNDDASAAPPEQAPSAIGKAVDVDEAIAGSNAGEPNTIAETDAVPIFVGERPARVFPFLRVRPEQPSESSDKPGRAAAGGVPPPIAVPTAPAPTIDITHLLQRWQVANAEQRKDERLTLEKTLAEHGFKYLPVNLVRQYLSVDRAARATLVDRVVDEPGIDSRPWLLLLVNDPDADVRLSAITMMATSHDPLLVERAWQVALRDRDPRIADFASRLRERRITVPHR